MQIHRTVCFKTGNFTVFKLNLSITHFKKSILLGFPGGPVVKNPLTSAGDMGSVTSLGRFYMQKRKK